MSAPYDAIEAVLNTLPDMFVLNETTLSPVIPPDHFGLMYYVGRLAPVDIGLGKVFRDHTWTLSVISPVTGVEAARGPLLDALHEVIDAIEASKTVRWSEANLEPFNDRLWCYNIEISMYGENVQDDEEEE